MPDDQSQFQNSVPDAIRRQIAAAEEMARQAGVRNVPDGPAADTPPSQTPPEPTADATAEQPPAEQPPAEQPPAETPPAEENWEQRYRSLQGRFDAEVNRSREMRGELNGLRAMVENLQQRQAPPQPPPQTYTQPPSAEIPNTDVEAYGQELIDATQRWAEARVAQRLQEYERRLLNLEGGQQQMQAMSAQQRVHFDLDRAMPDWRDVNRHPDFLNWLEQYDPFSGHKRIAMLQEAYGAGDSARTLAFFNAWKREHTAVSPPSGISPHAPPAPTPGVGAGAQVPLAQLAAPGRGSGPLSAPGASPPPRVWTGDDITRLSREYQRGLWQGREDEYDRRFQDILNAGREGRYRPT